SGLASNGIIVRTAAGAVEARAVVGGTGITVTNGDGVASNPTVALTVATQAQAEAGAINTMAMTPLRTAQAIAAAIAAGAAQAGSAILSAISGLASSGIIVRTAAGAVEARAVVGGTGITVTNGTGVAGDPTVALTIATQAEAEAGTISTKAMTPLRVAQAIAAANASALTANGYTKLPGGVILQWGKVVVGQTSNGLLTSVTFPIAFPTAVRQVLCCLEAPAAGYAGAPVVYTKSATATEAVFVHAEADPGIENVNVIWFAIGN
ncbi:gp53-like domain-containing protein, partial [Rhodobacter capsulatus]